MNGKLRDQRESVYSVLYSYIPKPGLNLGETGEGLVSPDAHFLLLASQLDRSFRVSVNYFVERFFFIPRPIIFSNRKNNRTDRISDTSVLIYHNGTPRWDEKLHSHSEVRR